VDGSKNMSTHTAPGSASPRGALGRAGRAPGQLWQVPTFFAGLLAVLAVAAGAAFRHPPASAQFEREAAALREALKQPRASPEELLPVAERLLTRAQEQFPRRAPEAHFLLGLVHARLADHSPPDRARDERKRAQAHLEQAEADGVGPQDLPRLRYYLGKLLYQSGGDLPRVIEYLSRYTRQGAEDPAEGYGMLVQAYLSLPTPDIDAALSANQKQFENTDDEAVLAPVRLQRAELLLHKGRRDLALKTLRPVGPTAPPAVYLKALYLQARCAQEEGLWDQAIPLWQKLLAEPGAVPGGKAHALYAIGLSHANVQPRDDARADSAWRQAAQLGGPDGQAAALRLARLRLRGRDPGSALGWFARALDKVQEAKDYQNALLPLDRARELFEAGIRAYREGQDHERALQLAELYRRLALPGVAEELLAQAAEARAESLAKKAGPDAGPLPASLREQAQKLYREAGAAYEASAAGRVQAEKALRLRRGADCYLQAREHEKAAVLLRQFLQLAGEPEEKAEGWFALAGAYRALKRAPQAREAYAHCIEYPQSRLAYRARLEWAELLIEQTELDDAEKVLMQNLQMTGPEADRQALEQTLYRLAELLFQRGQYARAEFRLVEALKHHPYHPNALAARDMLGECYRRLAEQAEPQGPVRTTGGPDLHYKSVRWENLEKARQVYDELAEELEKRLVARGLVPAADPLYRKAEFAAADCLAQLPAEFSEAVRRYTRLAERYRGRVEALFACQRLTHCCVLALGDAAQTRQALAAARAALAAARQDIAQIPDEQFRAPKMAPKVEWQRWLEGMSRQLEQIPAAPPPAKGRSGV
jgi:tetratricopeptide (TPR) repeat protein